MYNISMNGGNIRKTRFPEKGLLRGMAALKRREAREEVFRLLFETEFHGGMPPEEIFSLACEDRCFEGEGFIREVYFGVRERLEELDGLIARHSRGWRPDRITPVSRSILRLGIYEMRYVEDVPAAVAINEAVELTKRYDAEKARSFVNGVLNSVKDELEAERAL